MSADRSVAFKPLVTPPAERLLIIAREALGRYGAQAWLSGQAFGACGRQVPTSSVSPGTAVAALFESLTGRARTVEGERHLDLDGLQVCRRMGGAGWEWRVRPVPPEPSRPMVQVAPPPPPASPPVSSMPPPLPPASPPPSTPVTAPPNASPRPRTLADDVREAPSSAGRACPEGRECILKGCREPRVSRGLCNSHYATARKLGELDRIGIPARPQSIRVAEPERLHAAWVILQEASGGKPLLGPLETDGTVQHRRDLQGRTAVSIVTANERHYIVVHSPTYRAKPHTWSIAITTNPVAFADREARNTGWRLL